MKQRRELRDIGIPTDGLSPQSQRDYSVRVKDVGLTEVYFHNLSAQICKRIREADAVVGCVAWLTDPKILAELLMPRSVSIVVQKEDFLRPDAEGSPSNSKLRSLYASLRGFNRYDFSETSDLSSASDPQSEAIRCFGVTAQKKSAVQPRMHHKFLVFLKSEDREDPATPGQVDRFFVPYAVWTGSFNFTLNAARSMENAVVIHDRLIARAYMQEWGQILALSENLNWESQYVEPEYRIGT